MGFKDIDWSKAAKQTAVSYDIGRANAIINAKSAKNIQKVELLTGTQLTQRDPLEETIQMEKIERQQQPIISELKEIADKMQNFSDTVPIDINHGIDPTILAKHDFKMPSDIIKEIAGDKGKVSELVDTQKRVGNILQRLGGKSRWKSDEKVRDEKIGLQNYKNRLTGIKHIHETINEATSTSTSTSTIKTGKGIKNRIYYTNLDELTQRLKVLLGEVQAGNNSKSVKNEVADIAHHLYKKKLIKKNEYRNILSNM